MMKKTFNFLFQISSEKVSETSEPSSPPPSLQQPEPVESSPKSEQVQTFYFLTKHLCNLVLTRQVYNLFQARPVELVHYFGKWVEGPSKQTDRTDGGWGQSTFGAKAEKLGHKISTRFGQINQIPKIYWICDKKCRSS